MRWQDVDEVEHEGRTMVVRRLGPASGQPVVLVHGIGVGARYYQPLARVLARTCDVHVLELPGFGAAPRPDEALSIEAHADHVLDHLRSAGLDRPVLVGHSMGAQVVVEAALRGGDLVGPVVAMGPVVDPLARSAGRQGWRLFRDVLREGPSSNWVVLSDYAQAGPRWYLATLPAMLGYRTEEAVARLAQPLLLLRGSRDVIAPRAWVEELGRRAPDARVVEIPGAPHVLMWARPELVAAEILAHAARAAERPGTA
ncbi:alpha/beta fold hydrolase [Ornithinimicrobium cerasi]|uniref:Pimeloyl-ACP methyl ester carboxylesterase n=1 Tax=Ornithinimicrobium cerasi TaxID=2248773 RepID=A0A285VVY2_9MICO|nr:alpha/beta hydrolase [Ornithinimicrobium cerasi]SOC58057.1 Pimeloyl-ACP methyl ester carboxylesterase [Ornithinimicrobium cerasi]